MLGQSLSEVLYHHSNRTLGLAVCLPVVCISAQVLDTEKGATERKTGILWSLLNQQKFRIQNGMTQLSTNLVAEIVKGTWKLVMVHARSKYLCVFHCPRLHTHFQVSSFYSRYLMSMNLSWSSAAVADIHRGCWWPFYVSWVGYVPQFVNDMYTLLAIWMQYYFHLRVSYSCHLRSCKWGMGAVTDAVDELLRTNVGTFIVNWLYLTVWSKIRLRCMRRLSLLAENVHSVISLQSSCLIIRDIGHSKQVFIFCLLCSWQDIKHSSSSTMVPSSQEKL